MTTIQMSNLPVTVSMFDEPQNSVSENKTLQASIEGLTVTKQQTVTLNKQAELGTVSMSQLMNLLNMIIESSQKLRSQLLSNRIDEAMATADLAKMLAVDKKDSAQLKFGINLASSVVSMGIQTVSAFRTGQCKPLEDKHLSKLGGGSGAKVANLSPQELNNFTASLQQQRTAKYNTVSQMADMSRKMVGDINEIQNADKVRRQDETQSTKELKQKYDEHMTPFIDSLGNELMQLLKMKEAIQGTSLVTNR
ncbi:type III secretion system protein [Yersinia enterocolitica]|uniref:type III secretion system protein n=1 Tax=Yersinia enterocolitica TaxID=630 RepID=UPI000B09CA46|nr:type III secretion system protein [Yersinia enterocolitica]